MRVKRQPGQVREPCAKQDLQPVWLPHNDAERTRTGKSAGKEGRLQQSPTPDKSELTYQSRIVRIKVIRYEKSLFVIGRSRLRGSRPCLGRRASGSTRPEADGPSSLFGGFGVKLPILVPFKSKTSTASMLALDAYNRPDLESIARSSKPCGRPHSGTVHLVRNFPFASKTCIRLLIGSAT